MSNRQRFKFWLKHRTKSMSIRDIVFFKNSREYKDAKLTFLTSERKKLSAFEMFDYIYRQMEALA